LRGAGSIEACLGLGFALRGHPSSNELLGGGRPLFDMTNMPQLCSYRRKH
jgi:hypothetical protein